MSVFKLFGLLVLKLRIILLTVFILWTFYLSFEETGSKVLADLTFVFFNLNLTDGEKMRLKWGKHYDYFAFVRENTPEDSTIAIPPNVSPWYKTGGGALVYYFLYPRKTPSSPIDKLIDDPEVKYVLMVRGDNCEDDWTEWPNFDLNIKNVIYPNSSYISNNWGIIELSD